MIDDIEGWYAEFGRALADARTRKGMTQADLGRVVGMSARVVDNYEQGRDGMPAHTAAMLASVVGAEVHGFASTRVIGALQHELLDKLAEIMRLRMAIEQVRITTVIALGPERP